MVLKLGENYIVSIHGYNHKGYGVGEINGFILFVQGAIVGEIIEVVIKKLNKNYGIGEIVEVLSISPLRVIPVCDIYEKCGGCNLQHMDYKEQINFKQIKIRDALTKIGGEENIAIEKFYGMPIPYEYRNKVQIPFGNSDGCVVAGFYENKSHNIIDMNFCHIQFKEANEILNKTRDYIKKIGISIYDEGYHHKYGNINGIFRHLVIRKGYNTNEIMVVVVLTEDNQDFLEKYSEFLLSIYKNIKTIILNVNDRDTNVILGNYERVIYGEGYITDKIGDFTFRINSKSFFQVNTKQAEKLYLAALEMGDFRYNDVLLDAYCGIGTIGICASKKVKKVYGIEEVKESIIDAEENKLINNVKNIEFIHGKVEEVILDLDKSGINITSAILDPPRKGVNSEVLFKLREINCKKIVYISCNVSTLARDSKILKSLGYKISKVRGVDMFCNTDHVECVVLLSKVQN